LYIQVFEIVCDWRTHKNGDEHNAVTLLRQQGMSEQEAYDAAGVALASGYKEWNEIAERVSRWDSPAKLLILSRSVADDDDDIH